MIELKKKDKVDEYIRRFKVSQNKCPPDELKHLGNIKQCFHCENNCLIPAFEEIKEYKNYYKYKNKKYPK